MRTILLALLLNGSYVLNGITGTIWFFFLLLLVLKLVAIFLYTFFYRRLDKDGFWLDVYRDWDHNWSRKTARLFVASAAILIFQVAYYFAVLA